MRCDFKKTETVHPIHGAVLRCSKCRNICYRNPVYAECKSGPPKPAASVEPPCVHLGDKVGFAKGPCCGGGSTIYACNFTDDAYARPHPFATIHPIDDTDNWQSVTGANGRPVACRGCPHRAASVAPDDEPIPVEFGEDDDDVDDPLNGDTEHVRDDGHFRPIGVSQRNVDGSPTAGHPTEGVRRPP